MWFLNKITGVKFFISNKEHQERLKKDKDYEITTAPIAEKKSEAKNLPSTREELEAQAKELGITFAANIKDETLAKKIAEKKSEAGK